MVPASKVRAYVKAGLLKEFYEIADMLVLDYYPELAKKGYTFERQMLWRQEQLAKLDVLCQQLIAIVAEEQEVN